MSYIKQEWKNGDTITSAKLNNIESGVSEVNNEYTPTNWKSGDVITADKLNNIEQGIVNVAGGGVEVEALQVTQNGEYVAPEGKAYSPVNVNVAGGGIEFREFSAISVDNNSSDRIIIGFPVYYDEMLATTSEVIGSEQDVGYIGTMPFIKTSNGYNGCIIYIFAYESTGINCDYGSDISNNYDIQVETIDEGEYTITITPTTDNPVVIDIDIVVS